MNASRALLVSAAVAGDTIALERLLVLSQVDLKRYAARLCESDDVEEAVQEALWLLYSRVGALRTVASFSGWLFQIVKRTCNLLGHKHRILRRHDSIDAFETQQAGPVDIRAADPELRLDLIRAITRLEPSFRQILILRDVSGMSAEEAAERLDISVSAAKSRLHRARSQVRDLLTANASSGQVTL